MDNTGYFLTKRNMIKHKGATFEFIYFLVFISKKDTCKLLCKKYEYIRSIIMNYLQF